ncbi:putative metalloprotease CJM1_0395 family protein [Thalassospira sp.]|uniref:putative metalloprotease CJM1_0395 family protein n=1 Tax=Thalassospira sp. TaxID=1912094 RepID=UPI0027337BF8|nr:putative metalloprotease CJM1_0395 family protein [Thalassospira sp.]
MENGPAMMIGSGSLVSAQDNGRLGIVLNAQEISKSPQGQVLTRYQAVELARPAPLTPVPPAENTGTITQTKLVDPRTLTAAQARDAGLSTSEYREALAGDQDDPEAPPTSQTTDSDSPFDLNPAEKARVTELQSRDAAVRQEETRHAAAAGQYASAPQYQYTVGPDGKSYAIAGHVDVKINTSGSPEDVERAISILQNAAMAPNAPSGADMAAYRKATLLQGTNGGKMEETANPSRQNDIAFRPETQPPGFMIDFGT